MKEFIYLAVIRFFNLLCPILTNKILFMSYYGAQYGCNPKYLSRYLVRQAKNWDVVWAFVNPGQYDIEGIRKVRYLSLRYFYELCTSKVIVTNYRMTALFRKRKEQLYIQTWHSSLRLKMIERDAADTLPAHYVDMAQKDSKNIDLLLSGCRYSTAIFRCSFWYDGEIAPTGTPRNDLLFEQDNGLKDKIRERIGVSDNERLILYAPTFRKGNSLECYDLKYEELIRALEGRFGGRWRVAVRLHPHLSNMSRQLGIDGTAVIDATTYDDVQELLWVSDALITDYSSLMFDFVIMKRPCFLYVPDLTEYLSKDRKLYFEMDELPFPIAKSHTGLIEEVATFRSEAYTDKVSEFLERIGSYETGCAAANVANLISQSTGK
ncbi:CDP-glycerol glycerophosphotransferase family protein [Bacteroides sp. AN502(2024)]|uniref:CDP-glycerol glycerophosphotransferase family protein n=1 Tax=Bacteroides sp. AN502(2024) TaxID=3160599 RepID=UPI003515843A